MSKKIYNDIIIKTKDKDLLKFSYDDEIGIFYETINNNKKSKKNIILKQSFKYFYVTEDFNRNVNLICQDIIGNITLCILEDDTWKFKTLFCIKHNFIMPINVKGFYLNKDFKFLFNSDNDLKNIYFKDKFNTSLEKIYSENNNIDIDYSILEGSNYISLIIHSISFEMYKLILKSFKKGEDIWSENKIVYITNQLYVDTSYYISNNIVHFLLAINEGKRKSIIYKNINLDKSEKLQRETIIFESSDISSCLIIQIKEVLWALWISNDKIYGCYSMNFGEDFSKPSVYKILNEESIKKVIYIENCEKKEIYINEKNDNIKILLEEILNNEFLFKINYKEISYNSIEKEEIIIAKKEIKKLKEIVNNQKSQIIKLEDKLYKGKEF